MPLNNNIKLILFFLLFFIIVYLETFEIAGLKFAYLWKIVAMGYFLYFILKKNQGFNKIINLGYLVALKQIFSRGAFLYFSLSFISLIRSLFFPIVTQYIILKTKNIKQIENVIKALSISIVISGIPMIFNLLPSVNSDPLQLNEYDSSLEGVFAFSGIFQGSHPASISLAISLICLIFFYKEQKTVITKIAFIFMIIVGIYQLYITFIRTGWLMLALGILILGFYKTNIKTLILFIPILLIISFGIYYLYNHNDAFKRRLIDEKDFAGSSDIDIEDRIGSGRLSLAIKSMEVWTESNFEEKIMGIGEQQYLTRMKNGEIFSHNGFINLLVNSGLLGLSFFLIIIFEIFKLIYNNRKSHFGKLALAILIMYLIYFSALGGNLWFIELFLGLIIALLLKINKEKAIK